jgi:hypothetical protein
LLIVRSDLAGRRRLAGVMLTCALAAGCAAGTSAPAATSGAGTPTTQAATPAASAPRTSASPTPDPAALRRKALAEIAALAAKQPRGSISVAAVNTETGARFVAGRRSGMWTASAYKLFVLESRLLEQHGSVGYEAADAQSAIENSDNPAGYRLFLAAGGNAGLEAAARRFGMRHTVPGASDPTFTRTSAADFLVLVRNLVDPDSPLPPGARKYVLGLMSHVEADQRWGVSAAADPDTVVYTKNGWLSIDDDNGPGEADDGRWAVTSVGIIRVHGQRVLMAVFTQHQPLMGDGVHLVEKLARLIAPVVAPAKS